MKHELQVTLTGLEDKKVPFKSKYSQSNVFEEKNPDDFFSSQSQS
jgi:hypothetical protein